MASGDFELTIVISAIDDASAVLQTVAAEIVQDFDLISEQAKAAEADIEASLGAINPLFSELAQAANQASDAFGMMSGVLSSFESSLVSLQQDMLTTLQGFDQLASMMGSAMDVSGGGEGSMSGFSDFLSSGNPNPLSGDFSGFSDQQSDLMGLSLGQTGSPPLQVVQNNTFNGILDPSTIRDQIIPELELAVTRGATLLTAA